MGFFLPEDTKELEYVVGVLGASALQCSSDRGSSNVLHGSFAPQWAGQWQFSLHIPRRALIVVQTLCTCSLLLDFLYTPHWRSHAAALVCNYAILYTCIQFFRQRKGTDSVPEQQITGRDSGPSARS